MSHSTKISSDILVTTVFKVSLKVRGLLFIPLLTIFLGVSEYGAFVQVQVITSFVALVCLLGLNDGYIRYIYETERPGGLFTSLSLLVTTTGIIGASSVVALANILSKYTLQSTAYTTLFVLGGGYVLVHALFMLSRSYYRANRRIKIYSLFEVIDVYLSVIVVLLLVLIVDGDIVEVFAALLAVHTIVVIGIYAGVARDGGLARPTTEQLRPCLRFSVNSMGNIVSGSLLHKIDRVLIGFFLGASAVGIYSAAYSVGQLMKLYYQPINTSFFPEFSKLWMEEEFENIREYTRSGIRYSAMVGIPTIAGFALIGRDVLNLLSTANVAVEGFLPLLLIAAAMYCRGVGSFYSGLFFASGNSRIPFVLQFSAVVVNLLLNLMLIPLLDIVGAALATFVSFTGAAIALAALFQMRLSVLPDWSQIGRIVIASGCLFAIFWIVPISIPWYITAVTAPIVYFGMLFTLNGIEQREVHYFLKTARSIVQ